MSRLLKNHSLLDMYAREVDNLPLNLHEELIANRKILEDQLVKWKDKSKHTAVIKNIDAILRITEEYNSSLEDLSERIQEVLREKEKRILQRDYDSAQTQEPEFLISRNDYLSPRIIEVCNGFIQANVSWKYASLEVNPANGIFSNLHNAAEPQYCIADSDKVRDIVKKLFNQFYSEKRLRMYNNVSDIPDNCVGFASCINLFEYLPLDPIKELAKEVFKKLTSGGKFLITYNDCEERYSLELLDNDFRCLCTKSLISSLMYGLGFNILETGNTDDGVWSYMLLTKPGELTSQKLASPEIEFIPKIIPFVKWPTELQDYVMENRSRNNVQWQVSVKQAIKANTEWHNFWVSVEQYIIDFNK